MYWALRNWLVTEATRWGLKVDLVDTTDLDAVRASVQPGATKLVWVETPSNPLWSITDIAAVAEIAHSAGRGAGGRFDRRDADAHAAASSTAPTSSCTRRPST